jgi:O-succinylhomoserine sulfhydrylase
MFEERMRLIEGAQAARATATGMAAVTSALLCFLKTGDHIVAARAMFGSCLYVAQELCPRFGITCTLVDGRDTQAWARAVKPNTKAFFFETPANPTLDLVDIAAVSEVAHASGALVIVDNVFATPLMQKPLQLGADVVVYSTTKHIDGQGRTMGGAILGTQEYVGEKLQPYMRHPGPTQSPFNAWVLVTALETLSRRVRHQNDRAAELAAWLETRSGIRRVWYPGLPGHPQAELAARQMTGGGTVVTFEVDGGRNEAFALLNALDLIDISNNLGDSKSLITHPATTTHRNIGPEAREAMGIGDGVIRLSVGLEDPEDLVDDLERALTKM